MKVSNHGCIRRLSFRALRASRTRNIVAVLAIALTSLLFTSLFTIALSINEGIQQSNFRQAGGFSHGGFKNLTQAQFAELREQPLIRQWGLRRFVGMAEDPSLHRSHVEVGYSDPNQAHWMFCDPAEGRLPAEGSAEAATDTRVLELLGVPRELGAQFTLSISVDGRKTTQRFTLCGWWEYDEAVAAHHVLLPESRAEAILAQTGVTPPGSNGMTGSWSLDVMLRSGARSIAADLAQILADCGFQDQDPQAAGYLNTGVNWGYTGARMADKMDLSTAVILAVLLVLILLTGSLIIYNVFRISVEGDIRFYGLLKTIGTTSRQIRRIIRIQALALSAVGIPLGLGLGWLLGGVLTPRLAARMNDVETVVSASPALFGLAALFALATVLFSCRRPGRLAGRVSPVEAVRYTESGALRRPVRRKAGRFSLLGMAWANLGRSRGKTALTILSLSLAVVLLTLTVTFAGGFDLDKYLERFTASDFVLADADKLQNAAAFHSGQALPEQAIAAVQAQGGITQGGRVYGQTAPAQELIDEEWFRQLRSRRPMEQPLDAVLRHTPRSADGRLPEGARLYGMEDFALDQLTVVEGDLDRLKQPGGRCIAAVLRKDDYDDPKPGSHWARLGDTVTIRYVEEFACYDAETGQRISREEAEASHRSVVRVAEKYREVEYTVAALVTVPKALSYRYYGQDEFILGAEDFLQDTGTDSVMYYAFDADGASRAAMESFLQAYTQNKNPRLGYESTALYAGEFANLRSTFLLLGGALSLIVGLVGVLNFANAILTGITARRRELAVMQSIGMTDRQLRRMLAAEGLLYTTGAAALALVLLAGTPLLGLGLNRLLWFFDYKFTLWPLAAVLPVFAALGIGIPVLTCRAAQRTPVVQRLRQE